MKQIFTAVDGVRSFSPDRFRIASGDVITMFDLARLEKKAGDYTAAWNSRSPIAVAAHYAADSQMIINRGEPWVGRKGIADMAAGFYADMPDLVVHCDGIRNANGHAIYLWTLEGIHLATKKPVKIGGWEEWDLDANMDITLSRGWYDAAEYARQVGQAT